MPKLPITQAIKLAALSTHPKYFHSALVIKGGAILAYGYNHDGRHAEVVALSKLWPNKRKGVTVLSLRLSVEGGLAMAKPCAKCAAFLAENGVRRVYYSTREGEIVEG